MSDFYPTGKWRVRCEIADGNERLILQLEERKTERNYGYSMSREEVQWRDAKTTDLAMPENLRDRAYPPNEKGYMESP